MEWKPSQEFSGTISEKKFTGSNDFFCGKKKRKRVGRKRRPGLMGGQGREEGWAEAARGRGGGGWDTWNTAPSFFSSRCSTVTLPLMFSNVRGPSPSVGSGAAERPVAEQNRNTFRGRDFSAKFARRGS